MAQREFTNLKVSEIEQKDDHTVAFKLLDPESKKLIDFICTNWTEDPSIFAGYTFLGSGTYQSSEWGGQDYFNISQSRLARAKENVEYHKYLVANRPKRRRRRSTKSKKAATASAPVEEAPQENPPA